MAIPMTNSRTELDWLQANLKAAQAAHRNAMDRVVEQRGEINSLNVELDSMRAQRDRSQSEAKNLRAKLAKQA